VKQLDRIPLELALPLLVDAEHRLPAGSVRAVVEEDDVVVEQERRPPTARA
jgi:hypothetical protein